MTEKTAPPGRDGRRYWIGVGVYVVVLLAVQSVMGLGIDKFKELWGVGALEVVAYLIVGTGAGCVVVVGARLWSYSSAAERAWIGAALVVYGLGTLSARNPQERLHYVGYGILAVLLYIGFARDRSERRPRQEVRAAASFVLPAMAAFAVGSGIGMLDEVLQLAWPRRYFDWADVGINALSVGLGLLIAIPVWNALSARSLREALRSPG